MKRNHQGFAHWLLLVIIIIAIAAVGLFVFKQVQQKGSTFSSGSVTVAKNASDCSANAGLLKYSPVPPDKLSTIVPLGNFAPPGHVTPTPHMYYNYIQTDAGHNTPAKTDLVVPADMTITKLWLFDQGPTQPYKAYRLDFTVCKNVTGYFILILNLPDKLASLAQAPWDQDQQSNVGNGIQHNYWKTVNVKMTAGESLGNAGGFQNAPDGLDMGLIDTRVKAPTIANTERAKQATGPMVCSLDYYSSDLSKQLYAKLGGFDFVPKDPGEPKCGTVYQDVPGSAQGIWFNSTVSKSEYNNVDAQLTLGHWNLDHSKAVFSMGNDVKQIGLSSNYIYSFTPSKSGNVNLDFNLVKPGTVYCYDGTPTGQSGNQASILVELTDDKTMKLGKLDANSCGHGPWSMPSNSLTYFR